MFLCIPSSPDSVGQTIEAAADALRSTSAITSIQTWPQTNIAGRFIANQILTAILQNKLIVADISQLNFNVTFEVGYAIGEGKRIILTRNGAYANTTSELSKIRIFDTLGYKVYPNFHELASLLRSIGTAPGTISIKENINQKAPVYLIKAKYKTDPVIRIVSRVKKAPPFLSQL